MNEKQISGSQTAKNGFKNEDDIVAKFNDWKKDKDAQSWLTVMKYKLTEIEFVEAVKISGFKTDVQVQVTIKLKKALDVENLQVKLVSNPKGFNQIDKRWIDKYTEMWNIPLQIISILKRYTGEEKPTIKKPKDKRRMFANEFSEDEQKVILKWLKKNQSLIVSDILKGRGKFAAEWMLVAQKGTKNARWILKPMNFCMNYFGNGEIVITTRGNFKIGRITMQRKGGDGGRDTAKMLQFKINPAELFDNE
ncbi:MAG: type II restriction endonuclease [Sedimentibacter sp.]|uniref:type II restriction endonuclease n=1 Tax=Sedimentibacter sp. TaxID=1960295 RepID=UPI002982A249|nr:type II restriction endonuclease [Sedimentibacter sp.]MDW5299428.1 type II restriction endonuclease [Sedimentibacter sp.]